jgi:NDP-sugar pyrophosphorylase family protein
MTYRNLTKEETEKLISRNCTSENWSGITVSEGFTPDSISNTRFDGIVKLGVIKGSIEAEKNVVKPCGIFNSSISNCEIGDNVHISDVRILKNYKIEENAVISNVGSLIVTEDTTFGNGTEIEVLNEGGGRELPIYDNLSSQIAYLTVLYRYDKDFTDKILGLIKDYCESKRSDKGLIQSGARILDSLIIRNVNIGSYATLCGASQLEEGTIKSCVEAPVFIGTGVIARHFIILSGSTVDGGVVIEKCFIGQGVKMGKQYSAENSVFFANSEAFHGEACSLFSGPYGVTHHKSTLLIATLVSFFNAGSGTNQSNHMYKLGPLHQGILERGSKTGSFSYLLLPCHIGAYTAVVGKHFANFDTSDFPFSYISEEKDRSVLTPAMNLFTVGTRRDIDKWPSRDRRKDPVKLDLIHFELFSPYIVGKIVNAINILNELAEKTVTKQDYVNYKGIGIHRLLFKTTRKYYEMALKIYIGQEVVKRLKDPDKYSSLSDIRDMLLTGDSDGTGRWADICGMFSPLSKIDELINNVHTGKIGSVDELNEFLITVHSNYEKYAWTWCLDLICQQTGVKPYNITAENLIQIIADWKENAVKLNKMILKDAEKEFGAGSKIGFGIDGNPEVRDLDFKSVRGEYDHNKFVVSLQNENKEIEEKADSMLAILEKLK